MDQTNLEWQTFNGSVPKDAVSIYNEYVGRTDYVAKYGCEAGFYNPKMGPHCHYPYGDKELLGSPFEILVNKGNIERLEWKDGSYGSVPNNSVYTRPSKDIYVGKNEYGLGKVHVKHQAFFLPWEGKESWYKSYKVLTFDSDVYSEHISDVKYKLDGVNIIKYPPEVMDRSTITNNECEPVTGTANLSKANQVQQKWDNSFNFTVGSKTTASVGIPCIGSESIDINVAGTYQLIKGTTTVETTTHTVAVQYKVPANHSCTVSMVADKYGAEIPYTARVKRTYMNGETRVASITGTYKSVQLGNIRAVVGRSEPILNARPCARRK